MTSPNPYQPPETRDSIPRVAYPSWRCILELGLHWIIMLAAAAFLLQVVPSFEKVFKDFELRLPWHTQLLFNLSSLCAKCWFLLIPLLAADGFIVLRRHAQPHPNQGPFANWHSIFLLLALVFTIFAATALWIPFHALSANLAK